MEWAALIAWVITALFGFVMLTIWLRSARALTEAEPTRSAGIGSRCFNNDGCPNRPNAGRHRCPPNNRRPGRA